jgi:hypothetical protein
VNEELAAKGQQIIEHLGSSRQDILSKWMAHYVAELMQRAESPGMDERETRAVAAQCADLILKLWESKIQEEIVDIRRGVRNWFIRISGQNDQRYEELRDALANPEKVEGSISGETGVTLRTLSELENWLLELLWISEALNDPETTASDESVQRFVQVEVETNRIQDRVAEVFPAFAELPLADLTVTRDQVTAAFRMVDRLRHALIWGEN